MKKEFESVEGAYDALARDVYAFPAGRSWSKVAGQYSVYASMVSCQWWLENDGAIDRKWNGGSDAFNEAACEAAVFLRDNLLRTTGQRIWGLTFTLYPNGKFNIEYDYNKPEGYEETDDVIAGDEINRSLRGLTSKQSGP